MSCGLGCRCGSDLVLLWRKLEAVAPIQPLARELPYALGAALENTKYKQIKERKLSTQDLDLYGNKAVKGMAEYA